ncbi:MAG: aldo/keto reductase [Curvibacter sp.]|nr:aldo/keto reductase [Curvibacter sp.]
MKQIQIPGTDLQVSRLSFGTASLHHLWRQRDRQSLLLKALDAGFTHFDTSPYYGFGLAEQVIGSLPIAWRHRVTLATKVGLYAPAGALATVSDVYARKILGKVLPSLNRAVVDWSVARAQKSLQASLRRLRRERVDLLYLHEPDAELIRTDEWQSWLQTQVNEGRIRHWGLAGEAEGVQALSLRAPSLARVIQVRDSLSRHQADLVLLQGRPLQFTYGYLADPAQSGHRPESTLKQSLARNRTGSVLVSTRRADRIEGLARIGSSRR